MENLTITVNTTEARDVLNGLEMLRTKCRTNLTEVNKLGGGEGEDLRLYFKEKDKEIGRLITQLHVLLT